MADPLDDRRCTAMSKQSGERCKRIAIPNGTVCVMHGGKSPAVQAAAERRRQEAAAVKAVETLGLPRVVDPHTALLEELHRTAGAVEWLGFIVRELNESDVVWGRLRDKTGGQDEGTTHEAAVNVWVRLWQEERKNLAARARDCISAGIEERRVRMAESAGAQLASVIRAVLDRLELSDAQRALAASVVPEEFRRVAELTVGATGEEVPA